MRPAGERHYYVPLTPQPIPLPVFMMLWKFSALDPISFSSRSSTLSLPDCPIGDEVIEVAGGFLSFFHYDHLPLFFPHDFYWAFFPFPGADPSFGVFLDSKTTRPRRCLRLFWFLGCPISLYACETPSLPECALPWSFFDFDVLATSHWMAPVSSLPLRRLARSCPIPLLSAYQ